MSRSVAEIPDKPAKTAKNGAGVFKTSPTFETLVEQVRVRTPEEKKELRLLLDRELIAARRREIRENHKRSLQELKRGKLKFSSSTAELMKSLDEE